MCERMNVGVLKAKLRPWTREEEALLGTASDAEIGSRIGRMPATVAARRHKFHIPPAPVFREDAWSPEEDALLGAAKDEEIARRLNRPLGGVRGRRKKLGIKSPAFSSPCRRWTPEEDAFLGKMRDEEVSARTGHPLSGVKQRRQDRGIPLAVRQKRLWTPEEDKFLGRLADSEIASRLKRSIKSVQSRRLEKGIAPGNGAAEFSGKFGVAHRRVHLGIRVFNSPRHDWTADDDKLLGVRTDEDIAACCA